MSIQAADDGVISFALAESSPRLQWLKQAVYGSSSASASLSELLYSASIEQVTILNRTSDYLLLISHIASGPYFSHISTRLLSFMQRFSDTSFGVQSYIDVAPVCCMASNSTPQVLVHVDQMCQGLVCWLAHPRPPQSKVLLHHPGGSSPGRHTITGETCPQCSLQQLQHCTDS